MIKLMNKIFNMNELNITVCNKCTVFQLIMLILILPIL